MFQKKLSFIFMCLVLFIFTGCSPPDEDTNNLKLVETKTLSEITDYQMISLEEFMPGSYTVSTTNKESSIKINVFFKPNNKSLEDVNDIKLYSLYNRTMLKFKKDHLKEDDTIKNVEMFVRTEKDDKKIIFSKIVLENGSVSIFK